MIITNCDDTDLLFNFFCWTVQEENNSQRKWEGAKSVLQTNETIKRPASSKA